MPNPVVSFEIRGPDTARLRKFYADVFGWEMFPYGDAYTGIETTGHTHDEATGTTTYVGEDAHLNGGVELADAEGRGGWRFKGETNYREFAPGVSGGIGLSEGPAVTFYIQAEDLDAALAKVEQHGGKALRRPEEVAPNVVIAAFADPAGNEIGLIRG
jgi:predicted enzyme related to lactoylglutathione lyase